MKRFIMTTLFILLLCTPVFASEYGVADVPQWLNIRESPDQTSKIVGKMSRHSVCDVTATNKGYYHVNSGGIDGYVQKEYLRLGEDAILLARDAGLLTLTPKRNMHVYEEMKMDGKIIGNIYKDTIYHVIGQENGWIQIEGGYIRNDGTLKIDCQYKTAIAYSETVETVTNSATTPKRRKLVDFAMQYLGNPYVWGGTDPDNGADCSGFVQFCFHQCLGISIPRTSYTQCDTGRLITTATMRPGDLIFYGDGTTVGHVAMYIGNGFIVHARGAATGIRTDKYDYRGGIMYVRDVIGD